MRSEKSIRWISLLLLICMLPVWPMQAYSAQEDTGVPLLQEMPVPDAMYCADMPWYDQNDYPSVPYGSGTVANNGSGITALAMVATYMTGHEYTPDMLAEYFGGEARNNIVRLENGSRTLKLSWSRAKNWRAVYAALQEGKVAIVLIDGPCAFTESQHFVVLKGVTNDGKVLVNDPDGENYANPELQYGLAYGFETEAIWKHYGGAWIYNKAAMSSNPQYYREEAPAHGQSRYARYPQTREEIDLIARVVWAEARGETERGQQAVAEVVLNRLNSDQFPDDLYQLVYGEGQFRTAEQLEEATPNQTQYKMVERAIYGPYVLPQTVFYFGQEMPNFNVWGTIGRHVFCFSPRFPE